MSQWGAPEENWLTTLVQFAAFVVIGVVIILGLTAVSN